MFNFWIHTYVTWQYREIVCGGVEMFYEERRDTATLGYLIILLNVFWYDLSLVFPGRPVLDVHTRHAESV